MLYTRSQHANKQTLISKALTGILRFSLYLQFFLASIAYYSADDWVVWVNDRKITNSTKDGFNDLKDIDINKGKVVFEWLPER